MRGFWGSSDVFFLIVGLLLLLVVVSGLYTLGRWAYLFVCKFSGPNSTASIQTTRAPAPIQTTRAPAPIQTTRAPAPVQTNISALGQAHEVFMTQNTPPVSPEPVSPEPALPEPASPEPASPEPASPEPALPEPVSPEAAFSNPAQQADNRLHSANQGSPSERSFTLRSPLVRFALVAFTTLVLLFPLDLVNDMVRERSSLYKAVLHEINATWGGLQQCSGPVLIIPYAERQTVEKEVRSNGKIETVRDTVEVIGRLVLLPDTVHFAAELLPEGRQRGIYRSLVYTAHVAMNGLFSLPTSEQLERLAPALVSVDYANAYVVMGLSHPSALREVGTLLWNNTPLKVEPGVQPFSALDSGFRAPVRLTSSTRTYSFSQNLTFNGSEGLRFTPVGETTTITISSSWPHPSFQGSVLPATREITENGFKASWHIPSLARSYSNLGLLRQWPKSFETFTVGVDLHETGMLYHLIDRSVKYGILFIGLTFVAFMIFEMALRARLHPAQYALVGLSMVVFYLVLLSLSEHVSFTWAYVSAAACTLVMIALYAGTAMHSLKGGGGIAVLLAGLYTLLYAILQMEDYALIMGTTLVVLMLGALMYVSRNLQRDEEKTI